MPCSVTFYLRVVIIQLYVRFSWLSYFRFPEPALCGGSAATPPPVIFARSKELSPTFPHLLIPHDAQAIRCRPGQDAQAVHHGSCGVLAQCAQSLGRGLSCAHGTGPRLFACMDSSGAAFEHLADTHARHVRVCSHKPASHGLDAAPCAVQQQQREAWRSGLHLERFAGHTPLPRIEQHSWLRAKRGIQLFQL